MVCVLWFGLSCVTLLRICWCFHDTTWGGCVPLNTGHFCSPKNRQTFTYVFYRGTMLGIRIQELLHYELWICYNKETICMMLLEYKCKTQLWIKKSSFHSLQQWRGVSVTSLCLTKGCPCCDNAFFLAVRFENRGADYHASVLRFPVQRDELNEALGKDSPLSESAGKWPSYLWWCLQEVCSLSLITSAFIAGSTPAEANDNANANRFADARSVVDRFSNCL